MSDATAQGLVLEAGSVGTAVLYADKGALTCARVGAREGSRYVLETLSGERFAVAQPRLFWAGRTPVADQAALAAYWQRVQARSRELDLEQAWERLEQQAIAGDISVVVAGPGSEAEDAVAVAVFRDVAYFRIKDRVLVRESAAAVAETRRKRVEASAAQRVLACATEALQRRLALPQDESRKLDWRSLDAATVSYVAALIDVACHGRESEHWAFVQPLFVALGAHPEKSFDLLGRLGIFTKDTNLAPFRAKIPLEFPPEALAEAESQARYRPSAGRDFTAWEALAIDDADTTEVDDAVTLVGNRIYVFISDAAAWVPPGSLLDREAALRASTVYLPDGKLPMLPPLLCEGPMSLLADGPRSAMSFSFEIAADGRLTGFELTRAQVRIAARMTYELCDTVLARVAAPADGPSVSQAQATMLLALAAMMDRHRAWRHGRGAVTFQRPEVYFAVDPDGAVRPKIGDPLAPARQLIQELMVATCMATAVFCAENQIPCIYRVQQAPDDPPPVADPRTGRIEDPTLQYELLRRLKPTNLQLEVGPHWTLGVPAYTQVTSPIRRYADLLMHQQLLAFLKTGRPAMLAPRLQGQLFELGRRAVLVRRVEQESRRFFALKYLSQRLGSEAQVLNGTVMREIGKKTLVELQPLALHELVMLKRRRSPGTPLQFEVLAADARSDTLTLKEVRESP